MTHSYWVYILTVCMCGTFVMGLYIHNVCMCATHSRYVRHITTPLLITNHCDSEILALKEQTETISKYRL